MGAGQKDRKHGHLLVPVTALTSSGKIDNDGPQCWEAMVL
jgi:hypothetical protein